MHSSTHVCAGTWPRTQLPRGRHPQCQCVMLFTHKLSTLRCWQRRHRGPVAQWIRHRPTEPGIAGSSPAGVIIQNRMHPLTAKHCPLLQTHLDSIVVLRLPSMMPSSLCTPWRIFRPRCACGIRGSPAGGGNRFSREQTGL